MIERLMCALFGHKYVVLLTFSPTSRKVGCTRCDREWAMNDSVRAFVDWSGEFEELYKSNGQWPVLTDEEIRNEADRHVFNESFFNGAVWARGKIKEKNNG
jgi:hypothetical protein